MRSPGMLTGGMRSLAAAWIAGTALIATGAAAGAQLPEPPAEQVEAMERLAGWVGEWEGTGWAATGPGQRVEFRIVESGRPKVGGTVLLVEGRGTVPHGGADGEPADGAGEGKELVVHDALGLLSYAPGSGAYAWRTYDLRGGVIDADLRVEEDGLRWGFRDEERDARFRFTIRLEGDRWDEVGEISLDDGVTWHRMLEMTLQRRTSPGG